MHATLAPAGMIGRSVPRASCGRTNIVFAPVWVVVFAVGGLVHLITGHTLRRSFGSLRRPFCLTNGRLNDWLASITALVYPALDDAPVDGLLGGISLDETLAGLRECGFAVLPVRLPAEACLEIEQFARTAPAAPWPRPAGAPAQVRVGQAAEAPAPSYSFGEQAVLGSLEVVALITDLSLLSLARRYLGCEPVLDVVTMWWSQPWPIPSSEAAQLHHFDMDRVRFLKLFVYLTDVDDRRGPHCFVKRSHRRKPFAFQRDGRFSDELVARYYPNPDRVEICGSRGTILAVDTRGLHKGKPLETGERLVLQLEWANANSLFGAVYETPVVPASARAAFSRAQACCPRAFSRYGSVTAT